MSSQSNNQPHSVFNHGQAVVNYHYNVTHFASCFQTFKNLPFCLGAELPVDHHGPFQSSQMIRWHVDWDRHPSHKQLRASENEYLMHSSVQLAWCDASSPCVNHWKTEQNMLFNALSLKAEMVELWQLLALITEFLISCWSEFNSKIGVHCSFGWGNSIHIIIW